MARISVNAPVRFLQDGRVESGLAVTRPSLDPYLESVPSGFGALRGVRHSAKLSRTAAAWILPSMPPGESPPCW